MATIKDTFTKRKEYNDANVNFELPVQPSLYTKYYIDTWNIIPFYGKVDTLGIPVIPKQSSMRYCTYGTDTTKFMALQPVLDFFFPLREQYEGFYKSKAINNNSKYFKKNLLPTKGYIDSNIEYFNIITNMYRNFVDYLISNNKFNLITDYEIFTTELLSYIKIKNLYFTRAGYVESTDFSLLHTGLAIEIYKEKTSNDDERLNFYNDINQESFLELCIRNNMKIDREIPWRIFLDIRTKTSDPLKLAFVPKIKEYIPDFTDNIQDFFDTYYDRVVPYDDNSYPYFEEFRTLLQSFYFSFTNSFPTYKEYSVKSCGNANVKKLNRSVISEDIATQDKKYLKLYLDFRNAELYRVVSNDQLQKYTNMSVELFSSKIAKESNKSAILSAIRYYTNNIGTLAYRSPSLYELDMEQKLR